MSIYRGPYFPARSCVGSARPGAKALMSWFLGAYGARGGRNGGIYGCRPIAGTRTLSTHAEGRTDDLMTPPTPDAAALARWLVLNSAELGIQLVIYRRKVWSCRQPVDAHGAPLWRDYHGINPHDDHLHVELTPSAGETLTVARINAIATAGRTEKIMEQLPTLRKGSTGQPVTNAQALLVAHGIGVGPKGIDGNFGSNTEAAVRSFQTRHNLKVDGVIGSKQTWPALLDVL